MSDKKEPAQDPAANDGQPGPKPQQKKISIDIPKDLQAIYGNVAFISHTPAEMIFDFAQVFPRMPRGKVMARIVMSPMHAKMLHAALSQQIGNYERQFGEIRTPTSMNLASQFFKFPPTDSGNDDK